MCVRESGYSHTYILVLLMCVCVCTCIYSLSHILAPVSQRVGRVCVFQYTCACVCVYLYILSHILTPVSQRVRKELALAPPSSIAPLVFLRFIRGRTGGLLCAKKKMSVFVFLLRLKQVTLVSGRTVGPCLLSKLTSKASKVSTCALGLPAWALAY